MADDKKNRIKEIFNQVVDSPPSERAAMLDKLCGDDRSLRAAVQSLLDSHDGASQFMDEPTASIQPVLDDASPTADHKLLEGPGTRIGPYKLLELIGEGGFGSVFMAEQNEPVRRRVALKIIKPGMDSRMVAARFEAERQALALMDHPHIARVFDGGITDAAVGSRPYFVMEYVKGDQIIAFADAHKLNVKERLNLYIQVCQAVQHAHTKGIIHRDIKPSNILVNMTDGKPFARVIDFGIAKATGARLTDKTLFTEHRQLIGTPEYMSPEQAEGSPDIDTRTDVYGLGVLLYELLTGLTPFDGARLRSAAFAEMQRIIKEEEPPMPSLRVTRGLDTLASVAAARQIEPYKLGTLIKGELDWIVMKSLDKDRARRYETANALAADVQRHLDGEPVVAAPPSAAYRLRKFVRKHKGAVMTSSAVAAVLVIGIAGTTWGLVQARTERERLISLADRAREKMRSINLMYWGEADLASERSVMEAVRIGFENCDCTENQQEVDLLALGGMAEMAVRELIAERDKTTAANAKLTERAGFVENALSQALAEMLGPDVASMGGGTVRLDDGRVAELRYVKETGSDGVERMEPILAIGDAAEMPGEPIYDDPEQAKLVMLSEVAVSMAGSSREHAKRLEAAHARLQQQTEEILEGIVLVYEALPNCTNVQLLDDRITWTHKNNVSEGFLLLSNQGDWKLGIDTIYPGLHFAGIVTAVIQQQEAANAELSEQVDAAQKAFAAIVDRVMQADPQPFVLEFRDGQKKVEYVACEPIQFMRPGEPASDGSTERELVPDSRIVPILADFAVDVVDKLVRLSQDLQEQVRRAELAEAAIIVDAFANRDVSDASDAEYLATLNLESAIATFDKYRGAADPATIQAIQTSATYEWLLDRVTIDERLNTLLELEQRRHDLPGGLSSVDVWLWFALAKEYWNRGDIEECVVRVNKIGEHLVAAERQDSRVLQIASAFPCVVFTTSPSPSVPAFAGAPEDINSAASALRNATIASLYCVYADEMLRSTEKMKQAFDAIARAERLAGDDDAAARLAVITLRAACDFQNGSSDAADAKAALLKVRNEFNASDQPNYLAWIVFFAERRIDPKPTAEQQLAEEIKQRRLAEAVANVAVSQLEYPSGGYIKTPDERRQLLQEAVATYDEILGKHHSSSIDALSTLAEFQREVADPATFFTMHYSSSRDALSSLLKYFTEPVDVKLVQDLVSRLEANHPIANGALVSAYVQLAEAAALNGNIELAEKSLVQFDKRIVEVQSQECISIPYLRISPSEVAKTVDQVRAIRGTALRQFAIRRRMDAMHFLLQGKRLPEARAAFDKLEELMAKPEFANDKECQTLFKEAKELIEKKDE